LLISFFVGGSDANPTLSSREIEIIFLVCTKDCVDDSSFSDESVCVIILANPIGILDVTNNKITTKERIFN